MPAVNKTVNGFHRRSEFASPRYAGYFRPRADIDRQNVISHRWATLADDLFSIGVDAGHAVVKQSCRSELAQRPQIDMRLVIFIVPGDIARQHAGVGRVHISRNHGEANTAQGLHAEAFNHSNVAVASADKHEVL